MQRWFTGGFHHPLAQKTLCWGRYIRQSSCPGGFAEVGFVLTPMTTPGITLITQIEDRELLGYTRGVIDGIQAMIGEPPEIYGGVEIAWVHGIEHPVDSSNNAFARATTAALHYALGIPIEGRGISGGIGCTSRRASQA